MSRGFSATAWALITSCLVLSSRCRETVKEPHSCKCAKRVNTAAAADDDDDND